MRSISAGLLRIAGVYELPRGKEGDIDGLSPEDRDYHASHQSSKAGRRIDRYTAAKSFAYRSAAERWGKQREVALEDPAALVRAQPTSTRLATDLPAFLGPRGSRRWLLPGVAV